MPAAGRHAAVRPALTVLVVVLVAGCAGQRDEPTPSAAGAATTSTVAPTTTVPPMTAEELAWLEAIPTVSRKIAKRIDLIRNLTTSAMLQLAGSLRSCTRELVRGGSPSDRLQPVYVIVRKACKEYDKGAACFTTAARIGIPYADSPAERRQTKAIDRGFAAQGKGSIILADAENKGAEIEAEAG